MKGKHMSFNFKFQSAENYRLEYASKTTKYIKVNNILK